MLHRVQSVRGFVPVRPRRFDRLYRALSRRYEARSRPIVDFLNARLLIHAPDMEREPTFDAIRFDINPDALPRATIVRRRTERVFDDDAALADWLTGRDFNPRDEVHLDREPTPPTLDVGEAASEDRVEIVRYEPERVVMRVESAAPGYLVVSDQFFPGWRATVGGEPAEIVRANLCFRAVAVPAGVFTVTMQYRPWTLTLGFILSAATAVLLVGAVVVARIRR